MASLKKTAPVDSPLAIYTNDRAGFTWHVLKVYSTSAKTKRDQYARWFTAAKSPMTYGSWEYGDAYRSEIEQYGRLVFATPEFLEYLK